MRKVLYTTTDNLFKWAVRVFVFFLPFIWLPGITQDNFQSLFFDYGSLFIFFTAICLKAKRPFSNHNIPIIFIYAAFLTARYLTFSAGLLHLLCGSMLYYAIITRMDKSELKVMPIVILITAWANILALFFQIFKADLLYQISPYSQHCGFMALDKHLAMFLVLASAFCYAYAWIFSILIFGVLLYLGNTTALITFIAVFLIIILRKQKLNILYSAPILLAAGAGYMAITNTFYKVSFRMSIYIESLKEIFKNIFIGNGLGSFNVNLPEPIGSVNSSYSEYLRMMSEFGLIPSLLIMGSVFLYYKKLFLEAKQYNDVRVYFQGAAAVLLMCLFQDVFHFARLGGVMLVVIAMFELSMITKKEEVCF